VKNKELLEKFQGIHTEVLRHRKEFKKLGMPVNVDFDEFFADLYRLGKEKYGIIEKVNKAFPALRLPSLMKKIFGG